MAKKLSTQEVAEAIHAGIIAGDIPTPEGMPGQPEQAKARLVKWLGGDNRGPGKGFASPQGKQVLQALSVFAATMPLAEVVSTYGPMLNTNLGTIESWAVSGRSGKATDAERLQLLADLAEDKPLSECGAKMRSLVARQLASYLGTGAGRVPKGDKTFGALVADIVSHPAMDDEAKVAALASLTQPKCGDLAQRLASVRDAYDLGAAALVAAQVDADADVADALARADQGLAALDRRQAKATKATNKGRRKGDKAAAA